MPKAANAACSSAGLSALTGRVNLAGLCARGAEPLQAAVYGASAIARAGEILAQWIGSLGYLARELFPEIPMLLAP